MGSHEEPVVATLAHGVVYYGRGRSRYEGQSGAIRAIAGAGSHSPIGEEMTMGFLSRDEGQGLVEYALILVLVAIVVLVILALLGPTLGNFVNNVVEIIREILS